MIDFRYHIVSLVAVFLALGLGILIGGTVLSGPFTERLESDLNRARAERRTAQRSNDELTAELQSQRRILNEEVAPWLIERQLEGRSALFVFDGSGGDWTDAIRESVLRAGARPVGNLVLTEKWKLDGDGAAQELVDAVVRPLVPSFDPGPRPAEAALTLFGQRLPEPTGQMLATRLVETGFAVAEGREGDQPWPPRDAVLVVLAGSYPRPAPQTSWLSSFARGAADVTATLVVSESLEGQSAVDVLRETEEVPRRLSTFDSGAQDTSGLGVVSALKAAIDERGGHFGTEASRRYIPQPA